MNIPLRTTIVLASLVVLMTGCRGMGTQRFTAIPPSQSHTLTKSSLTILDVRSTNVLIMADYNLWENLHMLAPMPKRWKANMTLHVEQVVQGEFTDPNIQLQWLRDPTRKQREILGIEQEKSLFRRGIPLRIGFSSYNGKKAKNLKLMIRQD